MSAAPLASAPSRRRPRPAGWLAPALLLAALLAAWEGYVALGGVDPLILPAPTGVARSLVEDRALLLDDLRVTGGEVVLGIVVAVAGGLLCAVAVHLSSALRRTLYPLLVASQTIPIAVIAPLLVFWLGFGLAPKLAIIGLICFFPVAVATLDALSRVDPGLLKIMRTLGASRARTFRHVELPAALPGLVSGARIAVAVAVIAAVLAEQAGSEAGLGHLLLQSQFDAARSFAAVVLLSLLAVALFAGLSALERWLLPWARRPRGGVS
jgi:ABC-type nitrate/sulfonate/bicarbonate transport system permease component